MDVAQVLPNKWKNIGMVAGGSGVTPCLQVASELISSPSDTTSMTLIFCNRGPEDVFLRDYISDLESKSGGRFKCLYCVDKPEDGWEGLTGYVTPEMVAAHLPGPGEGSMVMVCGPPPMYEAVCGGKVFEKGKPPGQGEVTGILGGMGYKSDMVFKF